MGSGFGIGKFGTVCSLSLPAGKFILYGVIDILALALMTGADMAISLKPDGDESDLVRGINLRTLGMMGATPTGGELAYQLTLQQPASVYLKAKMYGMNGDRITGTLIADQYSA